MVASVKAVLLDLDGTLFLGRTAIPGAAKALEAIRASGVRVFFLTNASTRSRQSIVGKLEGMGIRASEAEVFGSAYMVADYIAMKCPGRAVFCISEGGLQDELRARGIGIVEDDSAGVVAVGLDRKLTYEKLAIAFRAISKGALFVASNDDPRYPVEDGFLPGAGAMVAAVERSTGKRPVVLGKPNRYGVEMLIRENGLGKKELLVVGDQLDTDVLIGKKNGIRSVLVLTGVTKKSDLKKMKKNEKPDYVIDSIVQLPALLARL